MFCPNVNSNFQKYTVASGHYTTCGSTPNPEDDLLSCPEAKRSAELSCAGIASQFTCPGDGRRHRWIETTTCTSVPITIPENVPSFSIAGALVVVYTGYNNMPVAHQFGAGAALSSCQQYLWEQLDQNAFQTTGAINLKTGVALNYENPNGCHTITVRLF